MFGGRKTNGPSLRKTHQHQQQQQQQQPGRLAIGQLLGMAMFGICCFYGGVLAGVATAPAPVSCPDCSVQLRELRQKHSQSDAAACPECPVCPVEHGQEPVRRHAAAATANDANANAAANNQVKETARPFPPSVERIVHDYATVPRHDFNTHLDVGVPYDEDTPGAGEVVVLYTSEKVLPKSYHQTQSPNRQALSFDEATSECDTVKVLLTEPARKGGNKHECIAVVPQWESYYVHKFMRLPPFGELRHDAPLRYVSRSHMANGRNAKVPSMDAHTTKYYPILVEYLNNLDRLLAELKPVVGQVANGDKHAPVFVLVCNWGQAGLFHNFVCNARAKQLDVSRLLIFATDLKTKQLAESLGVTAYYDQAIFGDMPEQAAHAYGDRTFTRMMMAKVYCVHLVSSLGYNLVFQDVDVVWFKDPVEYFNDNDNVGEWDMMFQDDGAHSVRYSPYSPNTGFYYVKNNIKTQFFFAELLRAGDVIAATNSHQAALTALLNEHASWKGLRVKVWNRGAHNPFPGGYEYHRGKDVMKSIFNKSPVVEPYIFHMSWTENKDNKKLYFEQMGEWYTKQDCTDGLDCCLAQPDIRCHYRDKPSIIPCTQSPPIDKGRPSFW